MIAAAVEILALAPSREGMKEEEEEEEEKEEVEEEVKKLLACARPIMRARRVLVPIDATIARAASHCLGALFVPRPRNANSTRSYRNDRGGSERLIEHYHSQNDPLTDG